eukprot:5127307-Alexandrium_andersonii.AAC.1
MRIWHSCPTMCGRCEASPRSCFAREVSLSGWPGLTQATPQCLAGIRIAGLRISGLRIAAHIAPSR